MFFYRDELNEIIFQVRSFQFRYFEDQLKIGFLIFRRPKKSVLKVS